MSNPQHPSDERAHEAQGGGPGRLGGALPQHAIQRAHQARVLGARRRFGLREWIVFTLPVCLAALALLASAVLDFDRIRQFDDWWSNATSVRKFGYQRARAAWNAPRAAQLAERLTPDKVGVASLSLSVDANDWERVDRDVAAHWGEWIDAKVLDGPDQIDARVRFRGDGSVHWTSEKKSLSVRTKRGDMVDGFRSLSFSAKDVLPQTVVNSLADLAGVLAPETYPCAVYLSGRFYGLFRFVEPLDETFLRRRSRMPGNIYRGDAAERGEYFKGVPRELFLNPYIWDRVAKNDRPGATGTEALFTFIALINGTTFEEARALERRLDRDELARFLALLLVCGDPYHMSGVHNQFWYEDPTSARLHPILWDLRLLSLAHPPPDSNINRFWRAALRDPRLWHETLRNVRDFLAPGGLADAAVERARRLERQYADELEYDSLRAGVISPVGSAGEVAARIAENANTLADWLGDAATDVTLTPALAGSTLVDVVARGRSAALLTALDFEDAPERPQLELRRGGSGFRPGGEGVLPGTWARTPDGWRLQLDAPEALLPGCAGSGPDLSPEPIAYRFTVAPTLATEAADDPARAQPALRAIVLENAWTRARTAPSGRVQAMPEGRSWHPWRSLPEAGRRLELSGDQHLTANFVVGPADTLSIAAGTRLRIEPDVSIYVRGKVWALGTENEPILIDTTRPEHPWGAFALQGPGTSGSRFEHVDFHAGGCALLEDVEYKGMVSLHNTRDVVFEHCRFHENLRCDDAVNVVSSEVDFFDCVFEDTNADALDLDLSGGDVVRCSFDGAGNDGLDLMTSTPRVVSCRIRGSRDKGISAGEGSAPVVFDTSIEGCNRGIEAKDRSRPVLYASTIRDCVKGLRSYAKNWRYDGPGWISIFDSTVENNGVDLALEDDAFVTTAAARFGRSDAGPGASGTLEPDPSTAAATTAWLREALGLGRPGTPAGLLPAPLDASAAWVAGEELDDSLARGAELAWRSSAGAQTPRLRRSGLVARIVDETGALTRALDLTLDPAGRELRLVCEVAAEDLSEVHAVLTWSDGRTARAQTTDLPSRSQYRLLSLPLPPDAGSGARLVGLEVGGSPRDKRGRLALRSWRILSLSPDGGGG